MTIVNPACSHQKQYGFSLLELTIVLLIASLLGFGVLKSFGTVRNKIQYSNTEKNLDIIQEALSIYFARELRLPCPANPALNSDDSNFGEEQINTSATISTCSSTQTIGSGNIGFTGTLPFNELGLEPHAFLDGWDRQFSYTVLAISTQQNTATGEGLYYQNSWSPTNTTRLRIQRTNTTGTPTLVEDQALYVLISHGPNGNGARLNTGASTIAPPAGATEELENLDLNDTFHFTDYSESETTPFDDLLRYKTEDGLTAALINKGLIKSKTTVLLERLDKIENAILGYTISESSDPDGPVEPDTGIQFCSCESKIVGNVLPNVWSSTETDSVSGLPLPETIGLCNNCLSASNPLPPLINILNLDPTDLVDPWGRDIQYSPAPEALCTPLIAGCGVSSQFTNAESDPQNLLYSLRSTGPNPSLSVDIDDTLRNMTKENYIGLLVQAGQSVD